MTDLTTLKTTLMKELADASTDYVAEPGSFGNDVSYRPLNLEEVAMKLTASLHESLIAPLLARIEELEGKTIRPCDKPVMISQELLDDAFGPLFGKGGADE